MAFGDTGSSFAQAGSMAGPLGSVAGAIAGTTLDIFGAFQQKIGVEQESRRFSEQQRRAQAFEINSLNLRRVQERLAGAQVLEDTIRAGEVAIGLATQSALESGVSGNAVKALTATKKMQLDRVRRRILDRQEQLDADYSLQNQALWFRTQATIVTAALELEQSLPSAFEIFSGLTSTGIAAVSGAQG